LINKKLFASLLSANPACFQAEMEAMEKAHIDGFHLDVMDGHFVPNLALSPGIIQALRPLTPLPFDIHLMMENPGPLLDAFLQSAPDILSIPVELGKDKCRGLLEKIRAHGTKAGLAINPETPWAQLTPYLETVEHILVMTVNPGFAGGAFQEQALKTLQALHGLRQKHSLSFSLGVDGAVTDKTAPQLWEADILVSGSYLFRGGPSHYLENITSLHVKS